MKIYGITGWKNCGKTGLMERLITEFTARGLNVCSIKHAHHSAQTDVKGTDSYRHRAAGARRTILATPERWSLMTEGASSLDDLITALGPADLLLIEGYKSAPHPKIECHRALAGQSLIAQDNSTIRALATDTDLDVDLPCFNLDDTAAIADFIWRDGDE